jgi:hypothetical protein
MALRRRTMISRRTFVGRLPAAAALATAGGLFMPALSRAEDRPLLTRGLQSGDVAGSSGMVWARRSAVPRPDRGRHHRYLQRCRAQGLRRCASRKRSHGEAARRRPAGGTGYFLPGDPAESCRADNPGRANGRALPHCAGEQARPLLRLVGQYLPSGLGHRPKLTGNRRTEAVRCLDAGESARAVARTFAVHHATISRLRDIA